MAKLIVTLPGAEPLAYPLSDGATNVGRHRENSIRIEDASVSTRHATLVRNGVNVLLKDLGSLNGTFVNGNRIRERWLKDGDGVRFGEVHCKFTLDLKTVAPLEIPTLPVKAQPPPLPPLTAQPDAADKKKEPRQQSADPNVTVVVSQHEKGPGTSALPLSEKIPLSGRLTLGRDPHCDVPLPSRDISRVHAEISKTDGQYYVCDLQSTNGTFINEQAIKATAALLEGARLRIGPYTFLVKDGFLWPSSQKGHARISVQEVSKTVTDRATRRPLKLLDGVSFVIKPNEFVALLGPSGSGKSTLMDAINGRRAPTTGRVMVNGDDLYKAFRYYRRAIGYVPQQDIVHRELTVEQALRYTAQLRLPSDTSRKEIAGIVDDIIKKLGLAERRKTLIRNLSGGQLKRVSLGVELIADPSLLFLDEATSGLDAGTEEKMMALFRQVADGGKTVACITHNVENVGRCDLVAVLVRGRMAYYGPPADLPSYFGVGRISQIYDSLESRPPDEWATRFEASKYRVRYVTERMAWLSHAETGSPVAARESTSPREQRKEFWRQFKVLTKRYAVVILRDWKNVAILFCQAPIIAVLIGAVFQNDAHSGRLVQFMMVLSAVWFGCTNAAKEIVKELPIYLRERAVNLQIRPYLASKGIVLSLLCALQCALLLAIVTQMTGLEGAFVTQFGILFLTSLTSAMMGLMISAAVDNADKAMALTPILLIPQVIFAGVIKDLTGAMGMLARIFIVAFWACDALSHDLSEEFSPSKYPLAFDLAVICLFLVATTLGALVLLRRKDRIG
jgi:ABC-type multidrug transport system ATPase subunit